MVRFTLAFLVALTLGVCAFASDDAQACGGRRAAARAGCSGGEGWHFGKWFENRQARKVARHAAYASSCSQPAAASCSEPEGYNAAPPVYEGTPEPVTVSACPPGVVCPNPALIQ